MKRFIIIIFISTFWTHLCEGKTNFAESSFDPMSMKINEDNYLGKEVPDIKIIDENGKEVSLRELTQKPLILLLIYYGCPNICPLLGEGLASALNGIGELKPGVDYNVLVLSFNKDDTSDDAYDYHSELKERTRYDGIARWVFATAGEENIRAITEAVGYRFFKNEDNMFVHPTVYIFLSPEMKITRYIFGTMPDSFSVRLALLESIKGITGKVPFSSRITLACYKYDPKTRSYMLNLPFLFGSMGFLMALMTGMVSLIVYRKRKAMKETTVVLFLILFFSSSAFAEKDVVNISEKWNAHFNLYFYIAVTIWVLVTTLLIYFSLKFRRKKEKEDGAYIPGNTSLEILWTAIPLIIVIFLGIETWAIFKDYRKVPDNAYEINVEGFMWGWNVTYPEGIKTLNELRAPLNKPIKVTLTSKDTLHAFFIPRFRVQEEAIPGRKTYFWFLPDKKGEFKAFCTEFCGTGHSLMLAKVVVMEQDEFKKWLTESGAHPMEVNLVDKGRGLVEGLGCTGCHSITEEKLTGPIFKGIYGRATVLKDGKRIVVDDEYIEHSIINPKEAIVEGYPEIMPPFNLSEDDLHAITEYLKSLK